MTKAKVLEAIEEMPEEFALDELFEHLLFIQKVEKGLSQSKQDEVLSNEAAKQRLSNRTK